MTNLEITMVALTKSAQLQWRYSWSGDGYDAKTQHPNGSTISLIHTPNLFRCFSTGTLVIHSPNGAVVSVPCNGNNLWKLLDAILESPTSIDQDEERNLQNKAAIRSLLRVRGEGAAAK